MIPTPEPQPEPTPQPFPEPTPNPRIEQPEPIIEQPFIEQPVYSGGGGGGGGRDFYETGRAFGGDTDIVDRESIQNLL